MKAKKIDADFDQGKKVTGALDLSQAQRPKQGQSRVNSVRRGWFWLAMAHAAIVPVVVVALMQVAPSLVNAIISGQVSLLGLWLVMGTGRLSRRLVIAFLCGATLTAMAIGLPYTTGTGPRLLFLATAALFSTAFQIGIVAIPLSYLRNTGWRLVDKSEGLASASGSPLQYRVSHLLVLTTLVAIMLMLRIYVQSFGTIRPTGQIGFRPDFFGFLFSMVAVFGVTLLLLSGAIITGFWACLGPHRPGYRLAISALLVTLLCTIPLHVAGGSAQVDWAVFITTYMAVVISSLLLLRYLGVRLVKVTLLRAMGLDAEAA